MEVTYNLISNLEYCSSYVAELANILFYSHVSTIAAALLLSIFIFIKNYRSSLSRLLLLLSLSYTTWGFLNLAIWFGYNNSDILMASWSVIEIFSVLLFIISFLFALTFIEKRQFTWWQLTILFLPILPVAILSNTNLYLSGYDAQECIAVENDVYIQYVRAVKILFAVLILGYISIRSIQQRYSSMRREIFIMGIGVISFVYSFLIAGYISEQTEDYRYEIYGLFGITVFIGCLAYLIVRYNAFNIKLVAAQALVTALALVVAAQTFFYSSTPELVIKTLTTLFVVIFGFFLVRSVKREIAQREQIEGLAKDLAKANKRLRELDKLKSEFVSIASHQLRSPLTAIRGYASMLIDGDFGNIPEKAKDPLSKIEESSRFMAISVDDFLNVSRIESGSMKYEKTTVSLAKLASDLVDEMRPAAIKRGLVLMYRSDAATDTHVSVDVGKVRQVIQNIVDNAMKYTPKGSITVVAHDNQKMKKAYVTVVDTGIGMNDETAKAIFDKFVRAKNANSVNVYGTGLGLYIAKQMIEAMGGSITPSSEGEGKGSKFTIELPLAE